MNIISSGLLMISAAGITFGLVHLRFWVLQRERKDQLAFSLTSISLGIFAWFEIALMRAETPQEYGLILKWAQPVAGLALVSSAWFIRTNLGAGPTLFWIIFALRGAAVLLGISAYPNINYTEISALGKATILGETLSYPIGSPNPLSIVPQAGLILLIIYALDACLRLWLKGQRRKAASFGTATIVFAACIVIGGVGVQWGLLTIPLMVSPSLLLLAAPMLYELNYDLQRSAILASRLIESERRLNEALDSTNLSAAAAHLGLWSRKLGEEEIHLSDKAREIFGFPPTGTATFSQFVSRIHPDDRERVTKTIRTVEKDGGEYRVEYRLRLPDDSVKWIDSRGKAIVENGGPRALHGASLDITDRKNAEAAVHDLTAKLMNAQEKERVRLARELHDDLSQRLALLSIRLEVLKARSHPNFDESHEIDQMIENIQELSTDVHRISHELHPAKLHQLGLEAALRGFCREIDTAHPVTVRFSSNGVPKELPKQVSLSIYRVAQEALQNVVKHSRAATADVELSREANELVLSVADDGTGFDPGSSAAVRSLGLTSMQERIAMMKGNLKIESDNGRGTRIVARIPVRNGPNSPS